MEGGGMILGIDPGPKQTALVLVDHQMIPAAFAKVPNESIVEFFFQLDFFPDLVGIECVACYGMAVGAEVFETAEWCGRIWEIVNRHLAHPLIYRVYRKQVKTTLCGTTKAKDSNIRQALIDLYPATGGGKVPQIGTKKEQGPLYGMHSDLWAALAVAHTVADNKNELKIWE
jgi:hypothetical protein